jgi:Ca2+-binding EF-hand superfamily protein
MRCGMEHGLAKWRNDCQRCRTPFVLNFAMMDSNNDGAIDQDEFSKACSAGLVKADEATVNDMK